MLLLRALRLAPAASIWYSAPIRVVTLAAAQHSTGARTAEGSRRASASYFPSVVVLGRVEKGLE